MEEPIAIPESFRGLDPDKRITIYIRNLPHWRQEGASYFVTFRLKDSIPAEVLGRHQTELKKLYGELGIEPGTHISNDHLGQARLQTLQQETARALEAALDAGHGACILKDRTAREPIVEAFRYHEEHSFDLHCYVIMPNHCHALVSPFPKKSLERVVQSIKSFSSRRIGHGGPLWQEESYDTIIRDEDHFRNVARYIHQNPWKARLLHSEYTLFKNRTEGRVK